jgi:hypothetical protein
MRKPRLRLTSTYLEPTKYQAQQYPWCDNSKAQSFIDIQSSISELTGQDYNTVAPTPQLFHVAKSLTNGLCSGKTKTKRETNQNPIQKSECPLSKALERKVRLCEGNTVMFMPGNRNFLSILKNLRYF